MQKSCTFAKQNNGERNKNDQPVNRKHSEKHARFSVANVFNSTTRENGGQHPVEPYNGKCSAEVSMIYIVPEQLYWMGVGS